MGLTLTLFPDGRALITADEDLTHDAVAHIREMFERWKDTPDGVAILQARVEHATSVELDLATTPTEGTV